MRVKIYRRGGVDIGQNVYIGKEVLLDEVYPEGILIGDNCLLTQGTKVITHFYNPEKREFFFVDVRIGYDSFLGMNVLIPKPLSIGNNCTIGTGKNLTKDIPNGCTVVSNPRQIVKRKDTMLQ